jgi:hypothetical protein
VNPIRFRARPEIGRPAEDPRELELQPREADESSRPARLELDQHVEVTARREVLAEHAS